MFVTFPAPYVASSGGVTSLAFHDDAYSSTDQITVPAGLQAGDLMLFSDWAFAGAGSPSLVTPSGFTSWLNLASGTFRFAVSYKIAVGSETTLTGMNSVIDDKILAVYRPDVAITTITPSTPTSEITNGNPSSQNIAATGGTLPLIAFGFYVSGNGFDVDPRTMSPTATGELNGGVGYHWVKYLLQNASLTDVSIDMDDEGTLNTLAGGYLWAA